VIVTEDTVDLIVETDCGHDPDDFFTLCYLVAAGVNLRCITVSPGDRDQLAIVRFFCEQVGLDISIGSSKGSEKYSSGSVHHALLKKYGKSLDGTSDGPGKDMIRETLRRYPATELLIIGPPSNVGRFLAENPGVVIPRSTMQGGFLGYDLHPHARVRLPQFEGKTWMPTFNMNGDRKGTEALLKAKVNTRQFCGKNVCHTILYDRAIFEAMSRPKNRASELFLEAMALLLDKHEEKKFHDPVAAVCHLHSEIGTWVRGRVQKIEAGWGTVLDEAGDYILADLDCTAFWRCIQTWT
jgi:pyrimidine-specific ribonucleoside hydrolase